MGQVGTLRDAFKRNVCASRGRRKSGSDGSSHGYGVRLFGRQRSSDLLLVEWLRLHATNVTVYSIKSIKTSS